MFRTCVALISLLLSARAFAADQVIVFGQTLPLTGNSSNIGLALQRGRQACADWVNKHAPLPGYQLRLVTRDDAGDPRRALEQANSLVTNDKAVALLGPAATGTSSALLRWAAAEPVAIVGPHGGEVGNRVESSDNVFFVTASQSLEAERLAAHIASLGIARVVVVRSMDTVGQASLVALEEALGTAGIPPVAVIATRPDGSDAPLAVAEARKAGAQALVLATTGRSTSAMLRATAAQESPRISHAFGLSSAASWVDLAEGGATGQGFTMTQVLPSPKDSRSALAARFRQALPDLTARAMHVEAEGCLAVLVMAEVLRRKPIDPSRAGVLRSLHNAGLVSLGGYDIDLADRMRGAKYTDIVYVGPDGRSIR